MAKRTFFQRFGHHGVCILRADVLSDDPLFDPDTNEELPSLREQLSLVNGRYYHFFYYAHVIRSFADGLYWADVAATPDFANTQRVVLTEEDLYHALPWDVRLQSKSSMHILKMMEVHARDVRPLQRVESAPTSELASAPVVPLEPLEDAVVVSNDDLQDAIGPVKKDILKDTNKHTVGRLIGSFRMQQTFLKATVDALMTRLYQVQDHVSALALKARCVIVANLQRWHRQTRQRVINAVPAWNEEQQDVVWRLTVGIPAALHAAA
jgi:hypothetical protein